ncbi:MAG: cyclase family protein [Anaerolineaceae bacterium]|nr:cyclase family protein [Anaerolineaceae bacterium]
MRRIYDITLTVTTEMPVWPGDPTVLMERFSRIEAGGDANISRISMGVHTGTHLDAPYHFFQGGRGVDELPLEVLIGPATVVRIPDSVDLITEDVLDAASIPAGVTRLLLRTRNSRYWARKTPVFHKDFTAISPDGAEMLVEMGIHLVGVDYLSVAPYRDPLPTHRILLGAGVIALEGLDLSKTPPGEYQLVALPVKLGGCDGAPMRAVLIAD